MSRTWWDKCKTTQGHGIYSQHNAEHQKEWIRRETRRLDKVGTDLPPVEPLTFHRESLHQETEGKHVENLHNKHSKHIEELKLYQTRSDSAVPFSSSQRYAIGLQRTQSELATLTSSPLQTKHSPHLSHRQNYGWSGPTPVNNIAGIGHKPELHMKNGDALQYCHQIHSKVSLISTRKA